MKALEVILKLDLSNRHATTGSKGHPVHQHRFNKSAKRYHKQFAKVDWQTTNKKFRLKGRFIKGVIGFGIAFLWLLLSTNVN